MDPRKKLKRNIILVFVILCIFLIVSYSALSLMETFMVQKNEDYSSSYIFYPSDYGKDIFSDPEYLDLNRYITVVDGPISVTVTDGDYLSHGEVVAFLAEKYIDSIIKGDAETYNSCFSEKYYQNNEPLERFTMQQLHNITLTLEDTGKIEDGEGEYMLYGYRVEYMIHCNNGSFRYDLHSDSIRPQYLVISDRTGEYLIDQVITFKNS